MVAAHGSDCDDGVNASVFALADRISSTGAFDEVVASFHRGVPHYSTVFDELESSRVTVVPFMTSDGYYCDEVLPRELARNDCFGKISLRVTPPVGLHPDIARIAQDRAIALATASSIALEESSLLVIGHGTRRNDTSRDATVGLAATLSGRLGVIESIPCFLEDTPTIAEACLSSRGRSVVAIVFLLTDGKHARRDVTGGLSLGGSVDDCPAYRGYCDGKFVVCDAPIGTDPAMTELVVDLATRGVVSQAYSSEEVA